MPRPMVPAPATPATRSLREESSMEGGAILRRSAGYNRPRGGGDVENRPGCARCIGGARRARVRPVVPKQANHAHLPLARGRRHGPAPAQARRAHGEAPGPGRRRGEPPRWQRHERPGGDGEDGAARRLHNLQLAITAFRMPHMQKVEWDPLADFTYIIGVSGYTFGIVVKADSPFKTFNDLLAYAKANPGQLSYATPGTGTSLHLAMEEIGA